MAKNNAFNQAVEKRVREFYQSWIDKITFHEQEVRLNTLMTRQQTLDFVTITLGAIGFSPEQLNEFRTTFIEAERELGIMVVEDGETVNGYGIKDHKLTYSKGKIEDELKKYVGEHYVGWDDRYGDFIAELNELNKLKEKDRNENRTVL